jgi:uncharacterized membrane-anchored protein YitT (DUF2179 family)
MPQVRQEIMSYVTITIGSIVGGISVNIFLVQHHLLSGGLTGTAMITYFIFGWPIGVVISALNIPLMYAAYRRLDKNYFIRNLYGMLAFSVAVDLTNGLSTVHVVDDNILAAIYGGVLSGLGSGIIFKAGGGTGGTDIIASLIKKYYALEVGYVSFSINCGLMTVAAFLFGFGPAMYTLLSMYISSSLIDKVVQGFNTKKTIIIISDEAEQIAGVIMKEVGRGATFVYGQGAFTRRHKRVLLVVITLTQLAKIKPIIKNIDPLAFMIIQDAVEVLGKGFTPPRPKV